MARKNWMFLLILAVVMLFASACGGANEAEPVATPAPTPTVTAPADAPEPDEPIEEAGPAFYIPAGMLITAQQLHELHSGEYENLVVIGVTDPARARIPFTHASNPVRYAYLVWHGDYTMRGGPYAVSPDIAWSRRPLNEMEDLLSRGDITHDSLIVVYAPDDMAQGARMLWELYILGFEAKWLDGGAGAWNDARFPTGRGSRLNSGRASAFSAPNYDPDAFRADLSTVIEAAQNPDEWVIIDVRGRGEFDGTARLGDAYGTGRIANSVFIPWTDAMIDDTNFIRPEDELREVYAQALDGRRVIVY